MSKDFLGWLDTWYSDLPTLNLKSYMDEKGLEANEVGVISADMVNGFCHEGPLASDRVNAIVEPCCNVLSTALQANVRDFCFVQEGHSPNAKEFAQYPPHCVRGTEEAEMIPEFVKLFAETDVTYYVALKNSLRPSWAFNAWLNSFDGATKTLIAIGNCTDLCLYQMVMDAKLKANEEQRDLDVIVPANCAQTFDIPVETANNLGIFPHDGDLMHKLFLYHMALNGATVVKEII